MWTPAVTSATLFKSSASLITKGLGHSQRVMPFSPHHHKSKQPYTFYRKRKYFRYLQIRLFTAFLAYVNLLYPARYVGGS